MKTVSPRTLARTAGALYLFIIVAATFAEMFVRGKLIVANDAAATAANILAHEELYRLGFVTTVVYLIVGDLMVAILFYELFKPVNRLLSLTAAALRLIFVAMMAVNSLNYYAPVLLIHAPDPQLRAWIPLTDRLYSAGFNAALILFGLHLVLLGYLIAKSTFLPHALALIAASGVAYVANSLARFLEPAVADALSTYFLLTGFVFECALTLWLLIAGVNVEKWHAQNKEENS